ncbi:unnamed protein product [Paramecium sonneborni]|uniref:G domain-containing protein n=1 Tax=Paramecium sonneborni TaxID=65129 RepID=A0A8S1R7P9_9CILI|nr:unnamed protein product [Paramecium sonneborni]
MIQQEQLSILDGLKYIYDKQIPLPDKILEKQTILFYFNLTENNQIQEQLKQLVTEEESWINGFTGSLNTESKNKNKVYYFYNLIIKQNNNLDINIKELIRIRLFLQKYISLFKTCHFKLIFHMDIQENDETQLKEKILIKAYNLLDGFRLEISYLIILNSQNNFQYINIISMISDSKINSSKIDFLESLKKIDQTMFSKINDIDEYNFFFKKEHITIGFKSQQYIQEQINVILKSFNTQLQYLQNNLQQLQEYPIDSQNENKNQNVKDYDKNLKLLIKEMRQVFKGNPIFLNLVDLIPQILNKYKDMIIDKFKQIFETNRYLQDYLNSNEKGLMQIMENFQFEFRLNECDKEIMIYFSGYYDEDELQQTIFNIQYKIEYWYKYFDEHNLQSLTIIRRLLKDANIFKEFNETIVFVVGLTKVGKSTFINILDNPENIIVTKDRKFDVNNQNNQFKISHENNSETQKLEYKKINDYILVDTPGIFDTNEDNRIYNLINIFKSIKTSKKFIIVVLIDGEKLLESKNDLITTIQNIGSMLPDEIIYSALNSIILPVFTKLKNKSTLEEIKKNWQSQTMQFINNDKLQKFLKSIKEQIDNGDYLQIYDVQFYSQSNLEKIKQERDKFQQEGNEYFIKDKINECMENIQKVQELNLQIQQIENNEEIYTTILILKNLKILKERQTKQYLEDITGFQIRNTRQLKDSF